MGNNYLSPDGGAEEQYGDGTDGQEPVVFTDDDFKDQPLPPTGAYAEIVCTAAELTKSKKGNVMLVVTLNSIGEPSTDASAKYYIVRSPGNSRWSDGLAVFAVTPAQLGEHNTKGGARAVASLFVGKRLAATGVHESYLGSAQFKFDNLKPSLAGAGAREFGSDDV